LEDLVRQIAIAEAINQQLSLTEQILSVHQLIMVDHIPSILLVDSNSPVFCVYFGIENEPYHFVIVVREKAGELVADFSYLEAAARVYLTISSQVYTPDKITERIGLTPTRTCLMGEPRLVKSLRFKEHRWYFEPQQNIPGNLHDKLNFLLDQLEPHQSMVASLQQDCKICINICYEAYRGSMGGWHIDREIMRKIICLGADVDLDLYAHGENDLPP
jgi:hypothetical protein